MNKGDDDTRARTTDWMSESNSATGKWLWLAIKPGETEPGSAHPLMLILSCETLKACSAIRTTTEKASLISKRAMSFISRPALFKAIGIAKAGASGKSMGLTPTSENAE